VIGPRVVAAIAVVGDDAGDIHANLRLDGEIAVASVQPS